MAAPSIFLDFSLPNATTWFYFSSLLAVALFFKFSRVLSIRNLDVLSLFVPIPGLLLVIDTAGHARWGYLWLAGASLFLLLRCLYDISLVRRPALTPNLNAAGLTWLALALLVSLLAVAVREPVARNGNDPAKSPPLPARVGEAGAHLVPPVAGFDPQVSVARMLTVLFHLVVVVGLALIGWWHFQDLHAGMAAATFYLLLPYTYLLLPGASVLDGQWYDVWSSALMIWAVAAYRRPSVAGLLLGIAAGSVFFPVLVLPVWVSFFWGRGVGRFLGGFVAGGGICLIGLAALAWISGDWPRNLVGVLPVADLRHWMPWVEPPAGTHGLWSGLHWAYRMPVFVAYLGLICLVTFWPGIKNLAHVISLSTALLLGCQFWYADQGGVRVMWYLPLLLLLCFRPNLTACQPVAINPDTDWLIRTRRLTGHALTRLLGLRPPVVKVP